MKWKITTLIENHEDPEGKYISEHGLSVLIEGDRFRMLMDTGKSGAFFDNAVDMGISFKDLDCMLLSHSHYDHTGGLIRMWKEKCIPDKLYVGKHFFRKAYHRRKDGRMKYIGTQFDSQMIKDMGISVIEIEKDSFPIADGVTLQRNFDIVTPYEELNPDFFYQEEELVCGPGGRCMDSMNYLPDPFEDETAVTLETERGLFLVVGCSHPGIVNMITSIEARTGKKICGLIGGTHLVDADEDRVRKTAEDFKKLGIGFVGVSHCTGDQNLAFLRESFGDSFVFNCTGNVIEI